MKKKPILTPFAILPFVVFHLYTQGIEREAHINSIRVDIEESFSDVYVPNYVSVWYNEELSNEDELIFNVSTDGGNYIGRHNREYDTNIEILEESGESLRGRNNAINAVVLSELSGRLTYLNQHEREEIKEGFDVDDIYYEMTAEDVAYYITLNENKRVKEIFDEDKDIIYSNEELEEDYTFEENTNFDSPE